MDNQLTVGQRIDVWEPVSVIIGQSDMTKGSHYIQNNSVKSSCVYLHSRETLKWGFKGFCCWPEEVKKCGYYLKVKEVKP